MGKKAIQNTQNKGREMSQIELETEWYSCRTEKNNYRKMHGKPLIRGDIRHWMYHQMTKKAKRRDKAEWNYWESDDEPYEHGVQCPKCGFVSKKRTKTCPGCGRKLR